MSDSVKQLDSCLLQHKVCVQTSIFSSSRDFLVKVTLYPVCKVNNKFAKTDNQAGDMKPTIVADEMFPEGAGFMDLEEAGGCSGLLMDLATNEKHVHSDFYNDFEDLFDEDEELQPASANP